MEALIDILRGDASSPADPSALPRELMLKAVLSLSEGGPRAEGFCWLSQWIASANVQNVLLDMLTWPDDAPALAGMVDCLETMEVPNAFKRAAWDRLKVRFENRDEHFWGRAQALRGAMLVSQGTPVLVKMLQAALLDVHLDDDAEYLRYVAKVSGAVLRQYPDPDFRHLLGQLAELDRAADEASLELGLDELKSALTAPSRDGVQNALASAHRWFTKALETSEQRPDAHLYELCTTILIDVQNHGLSADLPSRLPDLSKAALEYTAFSYTRHSASSWLTVSELERFHWISLSAKIAALARSFTKKVWLDAALVIEDELLAIFYPSREVFGLEGGAGFDELAKGAVIESLQKQRYYLQALDQWLADKQAHGKAASIAALRATVRTEMEASLYRRPFDLSTTSRLVEILVQTGFTNAEATMAVAELHAGADRNSRVADLWQSIIAEFEGHPDCDGGTRGRTLLEHMVLLLLRFMEARANVGVSTEPATKYLFQRGKDLPVEHDLQLDFLKFLQTNASPSFRAEERDKGGGRADISVEYQGGQSVVEVKKDGDVRDNATLAKRYAGQATGYLTTGLRYGFLLVLDLTDRQGHQRHITEQVSVERKIPQTSATEYSIVVATVQARRKTPHDLR